MKYLSAHRPPIHTLSIFYLCIICHLPMYHLSIISQSSIICLSITCHLSSTIYLFPQHLPLADEQVLTT